MKFSNTETTSALLVVVASHGYHYQYDLVKMCGKISGAVLCIQPSATCRFVGCLLQVKKFVFDGSEDFLELAQVASHASPEMGGGK